MPYRRDQRFSDSMFEQALLDGRSFRIEEDVNLAASTTRTYRLTATRRFIFRQQNYEIHQGGVEIKIYASIPGFPITESGSFSSSVFVRQKNFTDFRTRAYSSGTTVDYGGSITGGFQTYHRYRGTDINKSGLPGIPDTNLSISPAGVYYLTMTALVTQGGLGAVGIFEIHWDELLDGGIPT